MGDGAQQRALSGTRRALEEHVAIRSEGGDHQFDLASAAHHPGEHALNETRLISHWYSMIPRRFSPWRIAS
jgi:hypothetical protein